MRSDRESRSVDHSKDLESRGPRLLLLRLLLLAYPARFRRLYGVEMVEAFQDGWALHRDESILARLGFVFRSSANLVTAGVRERFRPTLKSSPPGPIRPRKETLVGRLTRLFEILRQDVSFAIRALRRRPGFTSVIVITLALGIGANSAIFSLVNGVLLTPLAYEEPERLIGVWNQVGAGEDGSRSVMSGPDVEDIAGLTPFEALVGYQSWSPTLTGSGEARVLTGARVTEGMLAVFGLAPFLGRDLLAEENRPDEPKVVVVSHEIWLGDLGGRTDIVGSFIELAGAQYEIVGIAPPGFDYPDHSQVWRPYWHDLSGCGRGCQVYSVVGKLREGSSVERAAAELDQLSARLSGEHPATHADKTFKVEPLQDTIVGETRRGLWILMGAVTFVLLIASTNVTNLLLVRTASREGEVAVRTALGAGSVRLKSQVLMEAFLLSVCGAALGVLIAVGGVQFFTRNSADLIPRIETVRVDGTVLLFTSLVALAATFLAGLAPAFRVSNMSLRKGMTNGRLASQGMGGRWSRGGILSAQVALSLGLLVGTGLVLKSFYRLYRVDLGFETEHVLRFGLSLPSTQYETLEEISVFYDQLETNLQNIPGVEAVGSAWGAPLRGGQIWSDVSIEGRPEVDDLIGVYRPVTSGYINALRIPLLSGRGILPSDGPSALPVAVISKTFAEQTFPGEDPLGRRFRITSSFGFGSPWWTVIGVVADVRTLNLTADPDPEVYVPQAQFGPRSTTIHVRTRSDVPGLLASVRDEVRALDSNLPLRGVELFEDAVRRERAPTQFYAGLIGLFAVLAVTLAAVGLYGVSSYVVSRRYREIGIRIALGANQTRISRMILMQGLTPVLLGTVFGLAAILLGAGVLDSLLYQVNSRDPSIYISVTALLLGVIVVSMLLPARRAKSIQPTEVLRTE